MIPFALRPSLVNECLPSAFAFASRSGSFTSIFMILRRPSSILLHCRCSPLLHVYLLLNHQRSPTLDLSSSSCDILSRKHLALICSSFVSPCCSILSYFIFHTLRISHLYGGTRSSPLRFSLSFLVLDTLLFTRNFRRLLLLSFSLLLSLQVQVQVRVWGVFFISYYIKSLFFSFFHLFYI